LLRPVDLPEGKVIGFFGLLSEWIDQDLLVRLARKVPAVHIVLIGKADVEVSKLKAETNIVILGAKQFSELPQYAAHFDVGIIPFVINDLTRAVNPIKLREMLAAGCPVVSTALPEVIGARDQVAMDAGSDGQVLGRRTGIWVAHNHEEFFAHTLYLLEHPVTLDERKAVSERMSSETWPGKVHEILRLSLRAESAKQ
jgi:glycosyltransferase involved in cell wall biosynthesis